VGHELGGDAPLGRDHTDHAGEQLVVGQILKSRRMGGIGALHAFYIARGFSALGAPRCSSETGRWSFFDAATEITRSGESDVWRQISSRSSIRPRLAPENLSREKLYLLSLLVVGRRQSDHGEVRWRGSLSLTV
jgi:hypothetical protein